ncbi:response regulator [Pontibacter flavimaris]|uniref:histidine kinase n=1 Tax=Pontibacter flavimaris TaxID=1797110 RepID=A0A1Q5PBZ0_9BACT|nr:response regulator [Pontibacter flavimaris]OKL39711.1 hybrid sensor histidine kinase/response regulator [Pontibacter flavimaris]
MNFIKNLKIRDKLILLLSLLLVPLVYFLVSAIENELEENAALKQEELQLEESERISSLLHAFQRERARMLASATGDTDMLLEAKATRATTDAAERELNAFLENSGRNLSELAQLGEQKKYRSRLDQRNFDAQEYREYSSALIFSLLNRMEDNATGVGSAFLGRQLESFRQLTEAKIHLARIRSHFLNAIQGERFNYNDYATIRSQITSYNRALDNFSRYAGPETTRQVQGILASGNYKKVAAVLQAIEADPQLNLTTFDPETVFNEFTISIEDLRKAETALSGSIKQDINARVVEKQQAVATLIIAFLLILGLTVALSIYIINLISSSLTKLKTAADRIKLGATDVTIDIHSNDEIGSVATSFRGVLNKTVHLSEVAQAIGEGRYEVAVAAQSDEDVLSMAIRDMKDNLQRFTTENTNRNFILTGVAELNIHVSGETSLEKVSEKVISFLCEYTGSEAGVLYLHHSNGKLTPAASYGVALDRDQLPAFAIGLGKVGQAVQERRIQVLEGVPEEHLRIKTGLSDIGPASVIIIPLYFADNIVGALELAARQPYTELHRRLFESVSERISVVIHTLKAHLQTQELLYETQNQAEELETQQEELRQLNAELKASEEELRVNQEELQEKNAELEEKAQLLEEQYEALGTKNRALEDAREAIELKIQQVETVSKYKSDFLANMSHELRTPLNSILILSRLLADNVENTLSTKQIDHAQIIHKSGNDLLRLINEILDLSKIESGMVKLETEELKLQDISMKPLFGEVAAKKQIRFTERIDPGSSETIITDRFRLEQILKNFIGNALKFTDAGGEVEFSITPVLHKPKFRSEQLREQTDILAFSVRDTGIGIPKEKQDMVFEAFQQADTSTTRKYGGTGLGLTISKELATLLGGELMLESAPGQGSTFTLYLPRVPQGVEKKQPEPTTSIKQAQPALTAPAPAQSKGQGVGQMFMHMERQEKQDIKVLIVEDDKGFSDILADFALAKNFKVQQAYTGQEGLQAAREEKPDAMLLDIHLPDMTGWDVLKQVREDKELRHMNVHVMSAYDKDVIGEHAENEEYLPKPVTLEMLNKAFSSILNGSDATIENILIVEDNEIENRAVGELLLAHGLKSTPAFSAEEAEQVLARQKVDCIILDLNLPGMKGYEWMKKIRLQSRLSDIPIIIYSGKDLSEEEEARLKEFANTIIIKNEYSYLRLLDEVQLFLHKVNQKLPQGKEFRMKLHVPEEVLRGKKVLVVDDDVRNIYSLSSLLEMHGMGVTAAYDGKEALQKLGAESDIDLVLMDVMMPEMDGIEATKRIREIPRFKQLPIIALTAKAMKEDREKCIEAGASDYIPKPVDTDKLLTLMRVWLYEA